MGAQPRRIKNDRWLLEFILGRTEKAYYRIKTLV
jgi:hypothetical protein